MDVEYFNHENLVIILGRGHSGSRLIAQTLHDSGFDLGKKNSSYDCLNPASIYKAATAFNRSNVAPDWSIAPIEYLQTGGVVMKKLQQFLDQRVTPTDTQKSCIKLGEITFLYPLLLKYFPNAKYIWWTRNARDACRVTFRNVDNMDRMGLTSHIAHAVPHEIYYYYHRLVYDYSKPRHFIQVKFEDFVLHQDRELNRLSVFLGGVDLVKLPTYPERTYVLTTQPYKYDFLKTSDSEQGYQVPS